MRKWWKSLTVQGAVTSALGFLADPAIFAVLPHKAALAIGVVGAAASMLGLRRAVNSAAPGTPARGGSDWENTFNAQGLNPYGETRADVAARRATMDATADDNRAFLMGAHYTPKPPLG